HIKEVADSLIVDIPDGDDSFVPLFVLMKEGEELTEDIKKNIKQQIKTQCSPRHVPSAIYEAPDLPKTLNGKKLEIPVKKILMGKRVDQVVNKGSLSNPDSLDYFVQFAAKHLHAITLQLSQRKFNRFCIGLTIQTCLNVGAGADRRFPSFIFQFPLFLTSLTNPSHTEKDQS